MLGALAAEGHNVTAAPTEGPGTAGRIARERIEAGADLILSFGGDGTLNEVLAGVVHTPVPLGMIPGGTANVFAREVGTPCNPLKAVKRLSSWVPRRVAAGLLKCQATPPERYFLLMAGIGFDAHIVYSLNLPLKSRLGEFAYWVASSRQLMRRLDEFEVTANGETIRCSFALATRVRNYAGYLQIARRVSLPDPQFEFVLFEGNSTLRYYLKYLIAVLLKRTSNLKGLYFLHGREMSFSAPADSRVYIQVDGEYAGRLPASVGIVPDAVTLLLPPEYVNR